MKRNYIIPATSAQPICQLNAICIGSVNNAEGLKYQGRSDGSNPEERPF